MDQRLLNLYCDPYFYFHQCVEFSDFVVVTAWNPRSIPQWNWDNVENNQRLLAEINHTDCYRVSVGNTDFSWWEESYAVDIPLSDALAIGNSFDQNAIYCVEDENLFLVLCLNGQRIHLGSWRQRCVKNFSERLK